MLEINVIKSESKPCKGLVYRGYNQVYDTKTGFEHKQGFSRRKRLSCPGCDQCGGLLDYANDCLTDCVSRLQDEEIKDGHYYQLFCYADEEFIFEEISPPPTKE